VYYYAGGKPLAMRVIADATPDTLYFLLTDHLGSTSVVLGSSGTITARQTYYPFGTIRSATGASPTDKGFTGQRLDSYIKLIQMGARWYDPELGRFISADSIVPQAGNPQALNRYAYALSNPLKYIDPSGHTSICGVGCDEGNWSQGGIDWIEYLSSKYGITFKNWNPKQLQKSIISIAAAVGSIGSRLAAEIGGTADSAFRAVYGSMTLEFCDSCVNGYGWAKGDHLIVFDGAYNDLAKEKRLVTHELGHIFDRLVCAANSSSGSCANIFAKEGTARSGLVGKGGTCANHPDCLGRIGHDGPGEGEHWGFAGGWQEWQFGATDGGEEVWADMFVGWTYNRWEDSSRGYHRQSYMDTMMSYYLTTNFSNP
jgi:RHS repeat-associated protein